MTTFAKVKRSQHTSIPAGVLALLILLVLAALPFLVYQSVTNILVNLFILLVLASMWNLLAGYGGLISVGQQAFVGLGAYGVLFLAQHGVDPFIAIPFAILVGVVFAVPASWFLFRLSGGYFAIATWVIAVVAEIAITGVPSLGGGTGAALPGLSGIDPVQLGADTYWASAAVGVLSIAVVFFIMRSRLGLVLTAVRDNEVGARSVGVKVTKAKLIVFLVSAAGSAAAGALIAISQLNVQAANVFNIQWSAYMIFAVLIGGIGTIEGPILGTIIFIVMQQELARFNAWYLIIVGSLAVVIAIWVKGGIWAQISERTGIRLFPTGYYVDTAEDEMEGKRLGRRRISKVIGGDRQSGELSEAAETT